MALLSPGIELKETTVQSTVVNNATGTAAIAGKFQWGPAFQITQITSEVELVDIFGGPSNETADYFMSGMNFLQYGNDLRVVRAVDRETAKNSSPVAGNLITTISAAGSNYAVGDTIRVKYLQTVVESAGKITSVDRDGKITGIYIPTGKIIAYAKSINEYPQLGANWTAEIVSSSSGLAAVITVGSIETDSGILLTEVENSEAAVTNINFQASLKKYGLPGIIALYPGELGDQIEIEVVSQADYAKGAAVMLPVFPAGGERVSTARAVFGYGPQSESQYAIIVRRNGAIVESVVLSTDRTEKDIYGNNIYMDDYFSKGTSSYIFGTATGWPKGFSGIISLAGGLSSNETVSAGDMMEAWDLFADRESVNVQLFIAGACSGESLETSSTVQKHVVAIGDERQDCLVLVSPPKAAVVNIPVVRAIDNLVDWRTAAGTYVDNNMNINSTYASIDGNYKYQYDKYNDVNRWVPLAADIAGLCARTDNNSNTWMSPAGYNRGQILNCIKLAIETRQAQRDRLYQEAINPVTGTGGDGFVLYGDKTATTVPSPFDRINVRRLFNMLKTNIGNASKYRLFELNNEFTRASFRVETSQYLQGIKALGGMYNYQVVCDNTNNTPAVIDRNEFVATFYVQPARSINFIQLNFVATATGADFDELVGKLS